MMLVRPKVRKLFRPIDLPLRLRRRNGMPVECAIHLNDGQGFIDRPELDRSITFEEWFQSVFGSTPAAELHTPNDSPQVPELSECSPELSARIIAMTHELFPGPIRVETDIDPEFPDDKRFVVEVEARGEFREIIERELRWHDKLWALVGKSVGMRFGICIFPK